MEISRLSYLKHVQQVVNRNLQKAMLGGIPGTKQLVKSYLKIILSQIQNPGFEVSVLHFAIKTQPRMTQPHLLHGINIEYRNKIYCLQKMFGVIWAVFLVQILN